MGDTPSKIALPDYIARLTIVVDIPIPGKFVADYLEASSSVRSSEAEILAMGEDAVRETLADWWINEGDFIEAITNQENTLLPAKCEVRRR